MDCNKEEALRARDIAEKKMVSRDYAGARKFSLKAQQLYPDLENLAQMLVVCDVHCSAEKTLFGNEMDWYGILQLEQTANDATIKKQYRKFALQLHPDKNNSAGAEAAFKLIGEAQRVLLDKEKRSQHDMRRRVPTNKTAAPRHNQHTAHMNTSSTMKTNVRRSSTNLNHQQQQSRKPAQQGPNGGRPTFWTKCPFCSVKYQYYREVLNKSLRCQHCNRPFIAFDVDMQHTSPANNSSQPAFGQRKDDPNHGAFKAGVGAQGNLHAEKSNTERYEKKGPADVSGKTNVKRKRKQVAESSGSSDSNGGTDSEDDIVDGKDGFPGVQSHSAFREKHPRRSTRETHKVPYNDNVTGNDGVFLRPSKRVQVSADLKDGKKDVKWKQPAVGGHYQMDDTSENYSADSTSKGKNHPNVYLYPDAEFNDFDKDKRKECFAAGQIWAIYDTTDGMPRFYALIRKVLSPGFKLQITWFEPHADENDEINWVNEDLPVACGKYKPGNTDITEDHLMFSHLVSCEKIGRNAFKVYPRKGETWALFKNWNIKWYLDVKSHQQYEFELVEILSDYVEGEGVFVAYLSKLKGFVSLFCRSTKEDNCSFKILPSDLFRFSHRVPSFKMKGLEGVRFHIGSYELDPASLPMNLEEVAVPESLDVKVGHSTCGGENTRSSNLAEENKDSVDYLVSTTGAIEIPDSQFFDFEAERSLAKFHVGQIWAFYSDEDGLPRYYGQISRIQTSPDVQLHVAWLTCGWLPLNTIRWEDEDMLIPCGRFKINEAGQCPSVYSDTSCLSHQVDVEPVGKGNYAIFPSKGEVWALYKNWSSKTKCSDLKDCEYDVVEVLGENNLWIEVLVLEEFACDFGSVFRGQSGDGSAINVRIPKKELLRFSHQIPAFQLTDEHGSLQGFWKLDPSALPSRFGSK